MFFKKGLRDPLLIRKLSMKNPKTSKAMFAITNEYALAEEATIDTREQKKEKNSGHVDYPSSQGPRQEEESRSFHQCGGTVVTQQGVLAQVG
jgi:hypothetical protein